MSILTFYLFVKFFLSIASFGLGQVVLPGRNFARFLLATYLLFCIVVRSAYQGKQFEFIQKNMRPASVETIDEMIEKNFTLYFRQGEFPTFQHMDFMRTK